MENDIIIKIENLGKKYVIGKKESFLSLRDSISRIFSKKENQKEFWALKDVNFEVKRGEIMGIIGRNGAGKSTILKILSRITPPTTGRIRLHGRVASLLEVGTGFHPELTGRENIWLNGAILGMNRKEIAGKFDEIVAFSEIGQFLDTPVKHYSSGMYVRLAFAVAAHLEPEILIVDEVLAVGDAEFQKKCLGKMGDVSKSGRTVIFVSHNMAAVEKLCQRVILIEQGEIKNIGEPRKIIEEYLFTRIEDNISWEIGSEQSSDAYFLKIYLEDESGKKIDRITTASNVIVVLEFMIKKIHRNMQLSMGILSDLEEVIFSSNLTDWGHKFPEKEGKYLAKVRMPKEMFFPNKYIIRTNIWTPEGGTLDAKNALIFTPEEVHSLFNSTPGGRMGFLAMRCEWDLKIIQ